MKLAVFILGAVLATTLAEHNGQDIPDIQNMPNINMLNNFKNGKMPEIPAGMKIEDLKDAFYQLPPSMKEKLNEMAQSFGMQLDDVEDALNNPPEKLKQFFDKNGAGPGPQGMPMGGIADLLKNVDIGSMASMLNGVDVQGLMKNIDPATISGLMQNMDMGAMGDIMKNMDMGAMGDIMKNVDIGSMMKNIDMGAMADIMKNVDIGSMMKNMDMGAMGNMMKNMNMGAMGNMMKNIDMGAVSDIMKNVDVGGIMKDMDMGAVSDIMKNVDMGSIMDMAKSIDIPSIMKGELPSLGAIKAIFGIPEDADLAEIRDIIREKLEAAGVPLTNPVKLLEYIEKKVHMLPLPEDMDPTDMLNMIHGQLEAMGIPDTDDPEKLKEFLLKEAGLEDIKDIEELKDPEIIAKILKKKAFAMLGLDANEDPSVIKDRIQKQLLEEAQRLGASLPDDYTEEQVLAEMDKVLTKEINEILGIDAKSIVPHELHSAVKNKLKSMGFPVDDFGALKKHVLDMAMKQLMKQAIPMVMNFFFPKPQMPQQMPPMMPPMGPSVPLNLDIEVNVEQPAQGPQFMPMPMPRYLQGAERALRHPHFDRFDDMGVFNHIMAVRSALRYGEMPEDALQELVEDLMNARLKARVMAVRNMFLRDRLAAMERDMDAMQRVPEVVPIRAQEDPLLMKLLRGPRVN